MLIALLLLIGVRRGGRWYTNVIATVLTLSFCFVIWSSLNSYRGWPIKTSVPNNAIFIAGIIDEPSSVDNDPGHIDLWLIPVGSSQQLFGYKSSRGEPRSYREPFSVPLEMSVLHAQELQSTGTGQPVAFSRRKTKKHGSAAGGQTVPRWSYRSYRLPPVATNLKGGN